MVAEEAAAARQTQVDSMGEREETQLVMAEAEAEAGHALRKLARLAMAGMVRKASW